MQPSSPSSTTQSVFYTGSVAQAVAFCKQTPQKPLLVLVSPSVSASSSSSSCSSHDKITRIFAQSSVQEILRQSACVCIKITQDDPDQSYAHFTALYPIQDESKDLPALFILSSDGAIVWRKMGVSQTSSLQKDLEDALNAYKQNYAQQILAAMMTMAWVNNTNSSNVDSAAIFTEPLNNGENSHGDSHDGIQVDNAVDPMRVDEHEGRRSNTDLLFRDSAKKAGSSPCAHNNHVQVDNTIDTSQLDPSGTDLLKIGENTSVISCPPKESTHSQINHDPGKAPTDGQEQRSENSNDISPRLETFKAHDLVTGMMSPIQKKQPVASDDLESQSKIGEPVSAAETTTSTSTTTTTTTITTTAASATSTPEPPTTASKEALSPPRASCLNNMKPQLKIPSTINPHDNDEISGSPTVADICAFSNLAFRFPDGSVSKHRFASDLSFSEVRKHVASVSKRRAFSLSMAFPIKQVFEDTEERSLLDLHLTPTASLIVNFPPPNQIVKKTAQISENISRTVREAVGWMIGLLSWLISLLPLNSVQKNGKQRSVVEKERPRFATLDGASKASAPSGGSTTRRSRTAAQGSKMMMTLSDLQKQPTTTTTTSQPPRMGTSFGDPNSSMSRGGNNDGGDSKKSTDDDNLYWNGNSTQFGGSDDSSKKK